MMLAAAERQLGRSDRHVRRGQLRIGPAAPRHRLAFAAEEALRLCALPGESEGRVYFFRRLVIAGLPEDGDRRAWLDAFQHGLTELARSAVHGADPVAARANAVFFRSATEACEALLTRIARRQSPEAWLWPAVSGAPSDASPSQHVIAVIETLLSEPSAWVAVAAVVQAAIDPGDPVALLGQVPEASARRWLSMLGDDDETAPDMPAPVRFAPVMATAIERAVAALGPEEPRVLWLAALAVVQARPSDLVRGVVVSRARASIRAIDPARLGSLHLSAPSASEFLAGRDKGQDNTPSLSTEIEQPSDDNARSNSVARGISDSGPVVLGPDTNSRVRLQLEHDLPPDRCFGAATAGAGLYFLLNALRHLKTTDDRFGPEFLAHLFRRMTHDAGIAADDPILLWVRVTLDRDDAEEIDERLIRLWAVKVRRWCWRNGRITTREVICRPGAVTLTATDLDVSLALDAVDIRIRRIGLDLDPGWLPWFGRVVRFHYLSAGELHA